jgi:hypothetical protein
MSAAAARSAAGPNLIVTARVAFDDGISVDQAEDVADELARRIGSAPRRARRGHQGCRQPRSE